MSTQPSPDQPVTGSLTPTPKIAAVGVVGSLTCLVVFLLAEFGIDLPAQAAAAIGVVLAFLAGYIIPDTSSPSRRARETSEDLAPPPAPAPDAPLP